MSCHAPGLMVNGSQMTGESVLCRGLAERRAIVTGAGSGIGRACAALLARQGTAVAVADLREDAIYGVVDKITADGARAIDGVRATGPAEKGATMPVAVTLDIPGGNEQFYEQMVASPPHSHRDDRRRSRLPAQRRCSRCNRRGADQLRRLRRQDRSGVEADVAS
jgi:NAD(P)-dependent dehydrogenase (short-subunit alcohol dehydrogenase family)